MLCTLEEVKTQLQRLSEADTADDATITAMARMASDWLAYWVDAFDPNPPEGQGSSLLEYFVDRVQTEEIWQAQPFVRLAGFPVVAVSEVLASATDYGLDDETPLEHRHEWRLDGRSVVRLTGGRSLGQSIAPIGGFCRITYSGGWWPADADPEEIPEGWSPVPQSKRDAAAFVAAHLYRHRENFGQRVTNVGTATINEVATKIEALMDAVQRAFGHLKFVGIG